jgi:hypothetical protein
LFGEFLDRDYSDNMKESDKAAFTALWAVGSAILIVLMMNFIIASMNERQA